MVKNDEVHVIRSISKSLQNIGEFNQVMLDFKKEEEVELEKDKELVLVNEEKGAIVDPDSVIFIRDLNGLSYLVPKKESRKYLADNGTFNRRPDDFWLINNWIYMYDSNKKKTRLDKTDLRVEKKKSMIDSSKTKYLMINGEIIINETDEDVNMLLKLISNKISSDGLYFNKPVKPLEIRFYFRDLIKTASKSSCVKFLRKMGISVKSEKDLKNISFIDVHEKNIENKEKYGRKKRRKAG